MAIWVNLNSKNVIYEIQVWNRDKHIIRLGITMLVNCDSNNVYYKIQNWNRGKHNVGLNISVSVNCDSNNVYYKSKFGKEQTQHRIRHYHIVKLCFQ